MNQFITIDGWRSNIRFSSAHIIHEYDKCGRLHGHTYAINVKIFGKPDDKGIIIDLTLPLRRERLFVFVPVYRGCEDPRFFHLC